jgi:fructokinase
MEVWELESDYIAEALTDYIMSFSPQKIILGGGVMKQEQMFPLVRKKVQANIAGYLDTPELADIDNYIVPNSLNEMQGILGCVELGRRALAAAQA